MAWSWTRERVDGCLFASTDCVAFSGCKSIAVGWFFIRNQDLDGGSLDADNCHRGLCCGSHFRVRGPRRSHINLT